MWSGCGCGSAVLAVAVVLLLFELGEASSESHAGLSTTFGQSNKQNQPTNNNNHQLLRGRPCVVEANCSAFANTSCVTDTRDGKLRCLCGDRKPPSNGACKNTHMAPGFKCTMDSDCIENAECVDPSAMNPNMTMSSTTMAPSVNKMCQCRQGFEEDDSKLHCTNGADTNLLTAALLLVSIFVQFWIL